MNVRTILYTAMTCILLLPASLRAQDTDARLKKLEEDVKRLTDLVVTLTENGKQVVTKIGKIDGAVEALTTVVSEQEKSVRAVAERGSEGDPILSLRSNMEKNPELRDEFGKLVNESIRNEGEIKVHNKTATWQTLKVNTRGLLPVGQGEIKVMKVPVGTVTTELVGLESPKNWTVGAPNYLQSINIEPASRVTVFRPTFVESVREVTVFRQTIIEPLSEITILRPVIGPVPVTVLRPAIRFAPVPSYTVYRTGLFGLRRTVVVNPPVVFGPPAVFWP